MITVRSGLFLIVAIVSTSSSEHHSGGGDAGDHDDHHVDYYAPAKYDYHYAVHDPKTGDVHSHSESRHGHQVTGQYELIDSDGHKRIVKYSADKHTGFKAEVHREPISVKIHSVHSGGLGGYSVHESSHSKHFH